MTRPARSAYDLAFDRAIVFMFNLYIASRLMSRTEYSGFMLALLQRAASGARMGEG